MRKLSLILAISFAVISVPAMAQNVTYACLFTKSADFRWFYNKWENRAYKVDSPFFLSVKNGLLTNESVSKRITDPICTKYRTVHICNNWHGDTLRFSASNHNGTIVILNGSTQNTNENIGVAVWIQTFECTTIQ